MKMFPLLVGLFPIGLTVLGCNSRYVIGQNDVAGTGGGSTNAGSGGAAVAHGGGSSGTGIGGNVVIPSGGFMGPGDMTASGGKSGAAGGSGGVPGTAGATASGGIAATAGATAGGGTAGTAGGPGGARPFTGAGPTPEPFSFFAARDYATGNYPISVAIGDLNGDGKLDVAVANARAPVGMAGNVSVLLGTGRGTLLPAINYDAGIDPTSVAIADLNGDGKPDLAIGNQGGGVSVLLNHGDGTFAVHVDTATKLNAFAVALGDLNGDGKVDIAVLHVPNTLDSTLNVLMNKGDGTFASPVAYKAGDGPRSVAIGDMDGDGTADVVVANPSEAQSGYGDVAVLLNKGNGTLATAAFYGNNDSPKSVAVGDLNGDGRLDIVYTDTSN